jgi:hypothetical protein
MAKKLTPEEKAKNYERMMAATSLKSEEAKITDAQNRITKYGVNNPTKSQYRKYGKAVKDADMAGARSRDIQRIMGTAGDWGPMETGINKPSPSVVKMLALEKARKKGSK